MNQNLIKWLMDQSQEIKQENKLLRKELELHQTIEQEAELNLEEMENLILIILDKNLEKSLDQVQGQEIDFHIW